MGENVRIWIQVWVLGLGIAFFGTLLIAVLHDHAEQNEREEAEET
jgi:hypothetical protein